VRQQTIWEYFGLPEGLAGHDVLAATANRNGRRTVTTAQLRRWRRNRAPGERDRAATWLRVAMVALALLAAAAAVVSYAAQYQLVRAVKTTAAAVIAALQARIPDAGALVFAALGIALALHGKRAIRAARSTCCVSGSRWQDDRSGAGRRPCHMTRHFMIAMSGLLVPADEAGCASPGDSFMTCRPGGWLCPRRVRGGPGHYLLPGRAA
jgi:hypothetical protein